MTLFSVAKKNIKRESFRSAAIVLSVVVVAATLFSVAVITESIEAGLNRGISRLGAELIIIPSGAGHADSETMSKFLAGDPGEFGFDFQNEIVDRIRRIKGVMHASPLLFLTSSENSSSFSPGLSVVGFDPKTDFAILPWLKKIENLAEGEALTGSKTSRGDSVRLYGTDFRIAGRLESTGLNFVDNSIFLPLSVAWDLSQKSGRISAVMVRTDTGYNTHSLHELGSMIEARFSGVKALVAEEMILTLSKHFSVLRKTILLTGFVVWIIALIMIGLIFSMTMNERQREIGLLRAMGATKREIFNLAMFEASTLSFIGGGIGVVVGGIFLYAFHNIVSLFEVHYVLPEYPHFAFIIILCVLLAFISGTGAVLYPVLRSSLMEPREAISKGN